MGGRDDPGLLEAHKHNALHTSIVYQFRYEIMAGSSQVGAESRQGRRVLSIGANAIVWSRHRHTNYRPHKLNRCLAYYFYRFENV